MPSALLAIFDRQPCQQCLGRFDVLGRELRCHHLRWLDGVSLRVEVEPALFLERGCEQDRDKALGIDLRRRETVAHHTLRESEEAASAGDRRANVRFDQARVEAEDRQPREARCRIEDQSLIDRDGLPMLQEPGVAILGVQVGRVALLPEAGAPHHEDAGPSRPVRAQPLAQLAQDDEATDVGDRQVCLQAIRGRYTRLCREDAIREDEHVQVLGWQLRRGSLHRLHA
mmetsp:Transcript_16705/g.29703  ORF Transcript_16705/g.29703 Transcript_16705/m.29703 type:complete len:228 (-) Transcript_16705:288-971(-)